MFLSPADRVPIGAPVLSINTGALCMSATKNRKSADAFSMAGFTGFLMSAFPTATARHVEALAGIPAATADNWLRGRARPSVHHVGMLSAALGQPFGNYILDSRLFLG